MWCLLWKFQKYHDQRVCHKTCSSAIQWWLLHRCWHRSHWISSLYSCHSLFSPPELFLIKTMNIPADCSCFCPVSTIFHSHIFRPPFCLWNMNSSNLPPAPHSLKLHPCFYLSLWILLETMSDHAPSLSYAKYAFGITFLVCFFPWSYARNCRRGSFSICTFTPSVMIKKCGWGIVELNIWMLE